MKTPNVAAVIERRLLVNYRADREVVQALLPPALRAQTRSGDAVVGICLLRMGSIRPVGLPAALGLRSESAAHRIAVEWDGPDGPRAGVFVLRRDTDSVVSVAAGGRLFPGVHHRARFAVVESSENLAISYASADGEVDVAVEARAAESLDSRVFNGLEDASPFFCAGSVGLSPRRRGGGLDAVWLDTDAWAVAPAVVDAVRSTYFDDQNRFPSGSIELDSALVMRNVPVTWRADVRRSSRASEPV